MPDERRERSFNEVFAKGVRWPTISRGLTMIDTRHDLAALSPSRSTFIIAANAGMIVSAPLGAFMGLGCALQLNQPWWVVLLAALGGAGFVGSIGAAAAGGVSFCLLKLMAQLQCTPPPSKVVYTGAFLGAAEGATIATIFGGPMAGVSGVFLGGGFGVFFARLAWGIYSMFPRRTTYLLFGACEVDAAGVFIGWIAKEGQMMRSMFRLAALGLALLALRPIIWRFRKTIASGHRNAARPP